MLWGRTVGTGRAPTVTTTTTAPPDASTHTYPTQILNTACTRLSVIRLCKGWGGGITLHGQAGKSLVPCCFDSKPCPSH